MNPSLQYARTQADSYDNIAPTPLQAQQAWQYAQTDNFFSPEEASAVIRQQLEPYRAQIEAKLTQIGFPPEHLAKHPQLEEALFSGQRTGRMKVLVSPEVKLEGRLRIVMTVDGPALCITPVQHRLTIPNQVGGVQLSKGEKEQLVREGALPRPFLVADQGDFVPTYLRVDRLTNTIELWRVRPELMPTKLLNIDLTKEQQLQLANGYAVRLNGLLDKQGEPFNATVSISATQKELQFTDLSRLNVNLKPDNENRQQLAINNEGAKTDLIRSQEIVTGSPTVSNHERTVMQQLLEGKTEQKLGGPKQRIQ